jgi:threonine/homoserine efflux transporter RhtA
MRDLKPMREEGQKSFASLVRALPSLAVTRATVVTSSQLTKLQLVRLAAENATSIGVDWVTNPNQLARNA